MFKLNLTSHFQTYLLFIFIVQKFFKFCNHLITNLKKNDVFIMFFFFNLL
jgi:hypothetical protein